MRFIVEGAEIAADAITRRDMNYGQACPGLRPLSYRIEVSRAEFVSAARDIYETYLEDTIADQIHGDLDFEELNELRALHFPHFDAILAEHPGLLLRIAKEFLDMDLVDRLLSRPRGPGSDPTYAINGVDRVEQDGDTFRIVGVAYPLNSDPAGGPAAA